MARGTLISLLTVIWIILCGLGFVSPAQGITIYVDQNATGNNNGTSWTDAYTDLQIAIEMASGGDIIRVSAGIYKPTYITEAGNPRTATFLLKNSIKIYGGYNGETILSGDIGIENNIFDNCYHVITGGTFATSLTVLDGFTITNGNADSDEFPHHDGGGMFNYNSSPSVSNCTFVSNSAKSNGGGIYNEGSKMTVSRCTFANNTADMGGGIFNWQGSPSISDSTFKNNTAGDSGGGMYNNGAAPTLVNCTFSGNTAKDSGGGMYNYGATPKITNCTIVNNTADYDWDTIGNGGGICITENSIITIRNTLLANNTRKDSDNDFYKDEGSEVSANNNLVEFSTGYVFSITGNQTELNMGILEDNGGPTETCALWSGSVAIDRATTTDAPTKDQRGFSRIEPYDIGAYEYQGKPSVTTAEITSKTAISAESGGNVIGDGGYLVFERGVCWSDESIPNTADPTAYSHTTDGTGKGDFTSSITGLTPGTTYYVRAYATNKDGTGYGAERSFVTLAPPSVQTKSVIFESTSAEATGIIISDWGDPITNKGICWSDSPIDISKEPTEYNNTDGIGEERFIGFISGLSPYTSYYVRAYATNSIGTGYGNEITFTSDSDIPEVSTLPINDFTTTTAKSGGNVISNGGLPITERGVCYSTFSQPTPPNDCLTDDLTGLGDFTSSITGLTQGTRYYVRAYATNAKGIGYGDEVIFTTMDIPTVKTGDITDISIMTASVGGNVTDDGRSSVTDRGICWSTEPIDTEQPFTAYSHTTEGVGRGEFVSDLPSLDDATTYYVRAYAKNSVGTAYGEEKTLITKAANYPIVKTIEVEYATSVNASISGEVTYNGGVPLIARGITWREQTVPMIEQGDFQKSEGTELGIFSVLIGDLVPETTYLVRAYATNRAGKTAYGEEIKFTTPLPLTVSTTPITGISAKTAFSGGTITSDGGLSVTARGVCWSIDSIPDTAIPTDFVHTEDGTGKGSFTSSVTGMTPDTTYYVRAYATNSEKTAYGEEITFATATKATVITAPVKSISTTTALGGGNVTDDGGTVIITRGVCWSDILTEPTLDNEEASCTTNDGATGVFESLITGLTFSTTYYVKAYTENDAGVSYGESVSFKTLSLPGDVNGDGSVDLTDAVLALQILAEIDTGDVKIYADADVNGDKQIGLEEVLYILRKALNSVTLTGRITGAGLDLSSARIKVSSDILSTTATDAEGNFSIQVSDAAFLNDNGEAIFPIEVTADGYATGYAKIIASSSENVEIRLIPISGMITPEDDLSEGITFEKDGEKVGELTLPDSALPSGVTAITGTVTYIDPTTSDIDAFPGSDFMAVSEIGNTDDPVMLETLGLTEYNLKDQDGNQITDLNGDAAICMKVPETLNASVGEKIPLWWYNPEDGLWHEDGYGIVEKRDDALWMCGKVKHFSWWNFDKPVRNHACFKFDFVKDSDGTPISTLDWEIEGITYAGKSPCRLCTCSEKDPTPCPDENISSFTVKRTENLANPEQIRVFTIIRGVRYYLKNDGDQTFSLVSDERQATAFNTPDVSGSCAKDENTDQCWFLDREDGILPLDIDGLNFAPKVLSFTATDQVYRGDTIALYPGQTIQITAQGIDTEGGDISVSWQSQCGTLANPIPGEGETISAEPEMPFTATVDFTAPWIKGYCRIFFKATDNKGNISESFANVRIIRDTQKEPPIVLSTKSLESGISVTFNKSMDASTLTTETFLIDNGRMTGTVTYRDNTATFTPSLPFDYRTSYAATITTGAKDESGNALSADYLWYFTIGSEITEPIEVEIGKISAMIAGKKTNVVYAIDQDKQLLYFIDTNAQHIFKKVNLPYPNPLAMDYSAVDNKLYIISEDSEIITVYDLATSVITEVPFASPSKIPFAEESRGFDIEVAPTLRRIYVLCHPNYDSYLSIIDMDTGEIRLDASELNEGYSLTIDEANQLMFVGQVQTTRYSIQDDTPVFEQRSFHSGSPGFDKILLSSDGSRVIHSPGYALYAYDITNLDNIIAESERLWCIYARLNPDGTILYLLADGYDDNYLYVMDAENLQQIRTLDFPNASEYGVVTPSSDGTVVVGFSCGYNCKEPALYFFTNVRR